jgi:CTP synthase (UTP-ammonia lyase)
MNHQDAGAPGTRTIVLVGEREASIPAHAGIEASIALYQRDVDPTLGFRWVTTAEVTAAAPGLALGSAAGVWCVPGSPYESTEGALQAIRHAREQRCVFLGTCGGFQHALMEYFQNVLGGRAAHAEMDPEATDPLIVKLACSLAGVKARVMAVSGSWFAQILGGSESWEEFNCNYGLAASFEPAFAGTGLEIVARDEAGQARACRLPAHPFFVGTLFQPERRALDGVLHPLVRAFLNHASRSRG